MPHSDGHVSAGSDIGPPARVTAGRTARCSTKQSTALCAQVHLPQNPNERGTGTAGSTRLCLYPVQPVGFPSGPGSASLGTALPHWPLVGSGQPGRVRRLRRCYRGTSRTQIAPCRSATSSARLQSVRLSVCTTSQMGSQTLLSIGSGWLPLVAALRVLLDHRLELFGELVVLFQCKVSIAKPGQTA